MIREDLPPTVGLIGRDPYVTYSVVVAIHQRGVRIQNRALLIDRIVRKFRAGVGRITNRNKKQNKPNK
jgi:hypothetical protein